MTLKQKLLLLGVILLAIFFRFYLIKQMPGGLFPDEAANGLDVNLMQQGNLQPFYQRGNGREALFFYMEWASTSIFGKGQWQLHATAAFIGVLSVIVVYFVTYRLFLMDAVGNGLKPFPTGDDYLRKKRRAINIALLASFLMAVSSWYVVLSRTAFRANLTPLFGALTLYFLLRTYQAAKKKSQIWFAILTGLSFGLGFYTYIAFRIMAPVLFMVTFWPLLAAKKRHELKQVIINYKLSIIGFFGAFVASVFWIADYFAHNFSFFTGRSGQVSIFNQSLYLVNGQQLTSRPPLSVVVGVFWAVLKAAVTGFFIHGDLNWRQNISGYPFLSPIVSPFFGIGLILISLMGIAYFLTPNKREKWWKYFLLTGWFWGMLLPELATAEGIPHGLRSAGAIAPTFIICAWAIYCFCEWAVRTHKKLWSWHPAVKNTNQSAYVGNGLDRSLQDQSPRRYRFINWCFKLVVVCFCAALTLQTYFLYFGYAANSPEYFYAFRADLTPVSNYLLFRCYQSLSDGQGSTKSNTFLVLDSYSVQTTDYLTSDPKGSFSQPCNVPYTDVDPASSWQLPPLKANQEVVFTQSTMFDARKFTQYHPEAHLSLQVLNKFSESVVAVYKGSN